MEYRSLGQSAFRVSCLAVGGNVFGQFCDARQTEELLCAAWHAGVNLIDTADVYGEGLSEHYIGQAIRARRQEWIVATKLGIRSAESPRGKATSKVIIERVNSSLRRLCTDYIDLYQLHHHDADTPYNETREALESLVKQGKIRAYGVSNFTAENLSYFAGSLPDIKSKAFVSHQTAYNLFKRGAELVFSAAERAGIGFLIYGALARGILSGKYKQGADIPEGTRGSVSHAIRADLSRLVLDRISALETFARGGGRSLTQLALAWVLRRHEVSSVIVGVRTPAQLEENLAAVGDVLTEHDLFEIDRIVGDLTQYNSFGLGSFDHLVRQYA